MQHTLTTLRKLKTVPATRLVHGLTESDRRLWIDQAIKELTAQGAKNARVNGNNIIMDNSRQFFRIPRLAEKVDGVLVFRSKDMVFKPADGSRHVYYTPKASDFDEINGTLTAYACNGEPVATYKLEL